MMEDQDVVQEEQKSDLAQLQAMAVDGGAAVPGVVDEPVPEIKLADEISGLLQMLVGVGAPMFPSLAMIYTPETVKQVGEAIEPVCRKHGWLQDGMGGKYKEEMLAMAIVAPLGFATWQGIKADIAARTKDRPDNEPVPVVIIGAVEQ
jgi:hypothetical protein